MNNAQLIEYSSLSQNMSLVKVKLVCMYVCMYALERYEIRLAKLMVVVSLSEWLCYVS